MVGPVALVGSGEFLPGMQATDRALLRGRSRRVAVVPTAAGPEGDAVVRRWLDLAHAHYAGLDAGVVEVDVRDRPAAHEDAWAARLADVGLVYLSGGNPGFLADTLRDTPLWSALHAAWAGGAALAGCSAGAMALAGRLVAGPWRGGDRWDDGLGVVPGVAVVPHFDRIARGPGRTVLRFAVRPPDDVRVVGVDEDTALVHDDGWRVEGTGGAWAVTSEGVHPLDLDVLPAPTAG